MVTGPLSGVASAEEAMTEERFLDLIEAAASIDDLTDYGAIGRHFGLVLRRKSEKSDWIMTDTRPAWLRNLEYLLRDPAVAVRQAVIFDISRNVLCITADAVLVRFGTPQNYGLPSYDLAPKEIAHPYWGLNYRRADGWGVSFGFNRARCADSVAISKEIQR